MQPPKKPVFVPAPHPAHQAPLPKASASVSFTAQDALSIAETLGNIALAINPAYGAAIALAEGAASLITNTILPAVQHLQAHEISVVDQAALQIQSALERLRVGAPPAPLN